MTFELLKAVFAQGNKHGSAFKEITAYYNADLETISDEQAIAWLRMKEGGGGDARNNNGNT